MFQKSMASAALAFTWILMVSVSVTDVHGQSAPTPTVPVVTVTPGVQSDDPWYISAGGAKDFANCIGHVANCTKVVGSHTYASAKEFYMDDAEIRRIGAFGYGVGHITSSGAKNWATYENREGHSSYTGGQQDDPADRANWRTTLQRVCSIDGHVGIGAGFGPRARNTSATGYEYVTNRVPFHGSVGLFMSARSACLLNPALNCNNTDYLRWTCAWDTSARWPNDHPELVAFLPTSPLYLPRGEVITRAEHGFFARETPIQHDLAIVNFAFNEYYVVSPNNLVEGCGEGGTTAPCDGFRSLDMDWVFDTNNHVPFQNAIRLPGNEGAGDTLTVLENPITGGSWTTCLDGDANDCQPSPTCGRNMSTWAITAQENKKWCWAAATQAGVGNVTGVFPTQCEIGGRLDNPPSGNCPAEQYGVSDWIVSVAGTYGVEFDFDDHALDPGFGNQIEFAEIKERIDTDGNAILRVMWHGGTTQHWVWVKGYYCKDGKNWIKVHSINNLVSNSSYDGNWTIDHARTKDMRYGQLEKALGAYVTGIGSFRSQ